MCLENIHDKIAQISINCFNSLPKSGKPLKDEFTVLSTIVKNYKNELEVIALATGSKCIGKHSMSKNGDILNDSHAEVLCRRAFLQYLYHEIKTEGIFRWTGKQYELEDGITFHFFTTHTPCGDATIFPKNDLEVDIGEVLEESETEVPLKKRKMDIFRTGAKCLQTAEITDKKDPGIEYHVVGAVRTKPGRGDPTLSVSCSDKISKWCHLGWQGALLTLLLSRPIFISTFTILMNAPFNLEATERALYTRLKQNIKFIHPYGQNKMQIGISKEKFQFEKVEDRKPCSSSIIYYLIPGKKPEVSVDGRKQGLTKKNKGKQHGRLSISKAELFRSFICILKKHDLFHENKTYIDYKTSARDYYTNWNLFKEAIGGWTEKDVDLQKFYLYD